MATINEQTEALPDVLRWQGQEYKLLDIVPIKGDGKRIVYIAENGALYMRFLYEGNDLIDWGKVEVDNGHMPEHKIVLSPIRRSYELAQTRNAIYQRNYRARNPEKSRENYRRSYERAKLRREKRGE